jgi:hypothetical protein
MLSPDFPDHLVRKGVLSEPQIDEYLGHMPIEAEQVGKGFLKSKGETKGQAP